MLEESKKTERSTTSVDLQVVETIWIDHWLKIDWLTVKRPLQNTLQVDEQQQHSVPVKFRRQQQYKALILVHEQMS